MKEFEVHYKSHEIIHANSLREANEKFQKEFPDVETVSFHDVTDTSNIQTHDVIGYCEVSGLSIFEGDDYVADKEGVMWLKEFEID